MVEEVLVDGRGVTSRLVEGVLVDGSSSNVQKNNCS